MGFMAVKYGVFEKLDYPWFEAQSFDLGEGIYDFCSEDVGFCLKAIEAGYKVRVNPKIIVGHEKKLVI
jgi:GT2 family glycosyltransferase